MHNAWFSFWHVLWSGEWVANVGLPMIVSLAALVIAYRFFRAQLAHDRQLVRDEADRAVVLRRDERFAAAVHELGAQVRAIFSEPFWTEVYFRPPDLLSARTPKPRLLSRLAAAADEVRPIIGSPSWLQELRDFTAALEVIVYTYLQHARRGGTPDISSSDLPHVVMVALADYTDFGRCTGEAMMRWERIEGLDAASVPLAIDTSEETTVIDWRRLTASDAGPAERARLRAHLYAELESARELYGQLHQR